MSTIKERELMVTSSGKGFLDILVQRDSSADDKEMILLTTETETEVHQIWVSREMLPLLIEAMQRVNHALTVIQPKPVSYRDMKSGAHITAVGGV